VGGGAGCVRACAGQGLHLYKDSCCQPFLDAGYSKCSISCSMMLAHHPLPTLSVTRACSMRPYHPVCCCHYMCNRCKLRCQHQLLLAGLLDCLPLWLLSLRQRLCMLTGCGASGGGYASRCIKVPACTACATAASYVSQMLQFWCRNSFWPCQWIAALYACFIRSQWATH
jgi:hypothetical protein